MAPKRFSPWDIDVSSTEGDVYSLAMTSFEVCFSVVNCHTIQCNNPVTTRSSRGYCHMGTVIDTRWSLILNVVNDHPVQQTQARTNGCRTPFGIRSQLAGTLNQNSDVNSLWSTTYFLCPVPGTSLLNSPQSVARTSLYWWKSSCTCP